jgi:hypothetical protein
MAEAKKSESYVLEDEIGNKYEAYEEFAATKRQSQETQRRRLEEIMTEETRMQVAKALWAEMCERVKIIDTSFVGFAMPANNSEMMNMIVGPRWLTDDCGDYTRRIMNAIPESENKTELKKSCPMFFERVTTP